MKLHELRKQQRQVNGGKKIKKHRRPAGLNVDISRKPKYESDIRPGDLVHLRRQDRYGIVMMKNLYTDNFVVLIDGQTRECREKSLTKMREE